MDECVCGIVCVLCMFVSVYGWVPTLVFDSVDGGDRDDVLIFQKEAKGW